MKTVNFRNFTVTTNGEEKDFFEEGLIHNDLEMLSIVDARKLFEHRYYEDPFFYHDHKDIEYVLDLYQKLELFLVEQADHYGLKSFIEAKMIEIETDHCQKNALPGNSAFEY